MNANGIIHRICEIERQLRIEIDIDSLRISSVSASDHEGENRDQNRIISDLFNQEEDIGPHPMPTEKIQSLETVRITETEAKQDLQCSVCFESYELQESVRKLPCNHLFHSRCVVPWLELHDSCPLCRKTFVDEEKTNTRNESSPLTNLTIYVTLPIHEIGRQLSLKIGVGFLELPSVSASDHEGEDQDHNRIISDLFNQEEDNGPPSMPTEKIQSLKTVKITEIEAYQDLQCSICFESYELQESVRKLPCNHLFHSRCVVPWLELHGSCPLCCKTFFEEEKSDVHNESSPLMNLSHSGDTVTRNTELNGDTEVNAASKRMPRKRKSDPSLYAWDEENMKAAVMAHLKDGMPIRTAATLHAVQKSTLSRYCKAYSASADEEKVAFRFTPRYDVKKVFSSEMEESYILLSSRMNYGLTKKRTKKLAWEFAKANTLKYPKSWDDNEAAGEDWYKGFMERHTRISLRRPESTSLHRNLGFNRAAVDTFYKHLEELQSKFHFPADRIYNMDETGLSNVQQKCRKVLSPKGVKQLGATTSQERGKLFTMVGTINAMGSLIPPYLIFGRTRFVERLLDGAPPGTKAVASGKPGNAWMTTELFLGYFEHFKSVQETAQDLDNYATFYI
ncbi:hypothetical protein QYM36_013666 [Artemia franciscana]|uniref:RING-type E3 ubiquitin transferase n=1 Tax=Artemia franciscana TaxID=6661 RepID=A0AA88KZ24_ARTSF|nr:hypothetical protein QYM36_013666 [Artemia franciscana]